MTTGEIRETLFSLQDEGYRDFQGKLIPGMVPDSMIGVRTPALRKLAKQLVKEGESRAFLEELPHFYFDENQLHAFMISEEKDFALCIAEVGRFLPYVDNWATCDQLSPKVFKKHKEELLPSIRTWIASAETYPVRFGIGMLMQHFLDEAFEPSYPKLVSEIRSEEYYVNMMIAWYFATALAKQYESVLCFIEERRLAQWTHNKAIQKAIESSRVSAGHKEYLRTLRWK